MHKSQTTEKDAYTRVEAAHRLSVSMTYLDKTLLPSGRLKFVKVGRRVLVPRVAIEDFLEGK